MKLPILISISFFFLILKSIKAIVSIPLKPSFSEVPFQKFFYFKLPFYKKGSQKQIPFQFETVADQCQKSKFFARSPPSSASVKYLIISLYLTIN